MKAISQRELRNESGRIMREVEAGAEFTITSRGRPIAVIAPIEHRDADGLVLREASGALEFPPRIRIAESTEDVLAELRGTR